MTKLSRLLLARIWLIPLICLIAASVVISGCRFANKDLQTATGQDVSLDPIQLEAIRVAEGTLPVIRLTKGSKSITLHGIIHSAPSYVYEEVNHRIIDAKNSNAVIIREGAGATYYFSRPIQPPGFSQYDPDTILHQLGLYAGNTPGQRTYLGGIDPDLDFTIDVSESELKSMIIGHLRSLGYTDRESLNLYELTTNLKNGNLYRHEFLNSRLAMNFEAYKIKVFEDHGDKSKFVPKDEVDLLWKKAVEANTEGPVIELKNAIYPSYIILDQRNEIIMRKLLKEIEKHENIFVLYGADHIDFFAQQLLGDGWSLDSEDQLAFSRPIDFWDFWLPGYY